MSPRSAVAFLALALSLLGASANTRAESPLSHIPADALAVIQVRGIDRTVGKLQSALDQTLADNGVDVSAHVESLMQMATGATCLQGLAADGPAFFVFRRELREGDAIPRPVLVLKTARFAELTHQLAGSDAVVVERDGDFAIVGTDRDAVAAVVESSTQLDSVVGQRTAATLLTADLAVYCRPSRIVEFIEGQNHLRSFLEVLRVSRSTDASKKPRLPKHFRYDMLLAGVSIREGGVAFHLQQDAAQAPTSSESAPESLGKVSTLPAGFSVYSESVGGIDAIAEAMAGKVDDPKLAKMLREAVHQAGIRRTLLCGLPGGLRIHVADEPERITLATLAVNGRSQDRDVGNGPAGIEYRGFRLYRGEPAFREPERQKLKEFIFANQPAMFQESAFQAVTDVFEQAGTSVWFGHSKNFFIRLSASDWEAATAILDRFLVSTYRAAQIPGFADCLRQLPVQGDGVLLSRTSDFLRSLPKPWSSTSASGEPAVSRHDPESYFGWARFSEGTVTGYDAWIPLSALRSLVDEMEAMSQVLELMPGGTGGG